jgi:hypothetical protein
MSVYVVRAFVKFREALASNAALARKLLELERTLIAANITTERQFREIYEAIRSLQGRPEARRRPIGFTRDLSDDST